MPTSEQFQVQLRQIRGKLKCQVLAELNKIWAVSNSLSCNKGHEQVFYLFFGLSFISFKKIKITVFFVFLLGFLQRVGFPQLEGGSWRYEQQSRGKRCHQWATYDASGVRTLPLDIPGTKFIPWFGLNRSSTSLSKKYRFIPDGFPLVRFY